jgi:hypothetical protein
VNTNDFASIAGPAMEGSQRSRQADAADAMVFDQVC